MLKVVLDVMNLWILFGLIGFVRKWLIYVIIKYFFIEVCYFYNDYCIGYEWVFVGYDEKFLRFFCDGVVLCEVIVILNGV